jgi:hypothetical protein
LSKARIKQMVEEAIVDAHDEDEQMMGFFTMIQDNLELPFETTVLGVPVRVEEIDLKGDTEIVAVCRRGRDRQCIRIQDLPLPKPLPPGAEWIEAYRSYRREG